MNSGNNQLMIPEKSTLARNSTFDEAVRSCSREPLAHAKTETLQINLGPRCNQRCTHCHVGGGPERSEEMSIETVNRVFAVVAATDSVRTLDITGGAPELNPNFERIVAFGSELGRQIIVRSNLTVLLENSLDGLPSFLAKYHAVIIASLPCYLSSNVDRQRGAGTFEKCIQAIRLLNTAGYGMPGSDLKLNLVHNPLGPSLPGRQEDLEVAYRTNLRSLYGIEFSRLLTITNMAIGRFGESLRSQGKEESYSELLAASFNPATVQEVMCRKLISVGWEGTLYDCDFNQALALKHEDDTGSIWKISSLDAWEGRRIMTGPHCFGCTAGAGSSCGGSLQ